jgi:ABC-2 type transport system permease protein
MNNLRQAIWVEALKARRSRMPLYTALGFALLPLGGGLFMVILKNPELARQVGLISAKAQLTMGAADWPTYLSFLSQAVAVGGILLFGLVGVWAFGREYSDRTIKDLLALPTARSSIVLAKFVVVAAWSAVLTGIVCLIGLVVGFAVGLVPVPTSVLMQGMVTTGVAAGLTILLVTPITFFACVGHGYLPPIGMMFLLVGLAQVSVIIGWGEFFPWAIPALYAQGEKLGLISFASVVLTSIIGVAGTVAWWELADQAR